jgi:hypothetical protein
MISISTNINGVTTVLLRKLEVLRDPRPLLRVVAFDVVSMMTERIHDRGEAADGGKIGTYSNSYLALRQRKYKRKADKEVKVSLTRQLENNWSVISTTNGWGIGFTNGFNAQKMRWVEQQKGKKIAALTTSERDYAVAKIKSLIAEALA